MHHDAAAFRRFFSSPAFPPDGLPTILTPSHPLDIPAKTPTPDAQLGTSPAALFLSAFSPVTSKPKPLGPVDEDGSVVGGFVLGPVFAHGAFSTIRRATSSGTGAVVAVKVVPRSPSASISQRRRLANEEAVWTSLSHEHILPLFAAIHTPTTDFFITQLCPAGSLFDIMRGGTPGRDDAGRMFRQIVRGLRYLHCEKRLVHRDIKLENVLVDEAGVCRIADFGMARGMDEDEPELGSDDDDSSGPAIPLPLPLALPVHKSTHHGPGVHRAVSLAVPRGSASTIRRDRTASVPASAATPPSTTETEFQPGSLPYAAPELLGAPKDKAKTTLTASLSLKGRVHGYAAGERDPGAGKSSSAFLARTATISSASSSSSSIASSASSSTTNTMDAPIPITTPTRPHPAQDIWALGVLLYALLVGTLPFADAFEPRLVLKILGGTYPPPPPSTPRGTLAVLRGCLTSRVADRWTVERVDEHAWAVGGEDVPLSPPDDVLALADDADSALEDCEYDPADDGVMRKKPKQKVPAPLDLGMEMDRAQRPLERGRPSAAMRRAERSESRAPYTTDRPPIVRSASRPSPESSPVRTRPPSTSTRWDEERSTSRRSVSRSASRTGSGSGSLSMSRSRTRTSASRSRSPGPPRTPVDVLSPLLGMGIGLGLALPVPLTKTEEFVREGRRRARDPPRSAPVPVVGEEDGDGDGDGENEVGMLMAGMTMSPVEDGDA